ncbi:MAG TPA: trehalose-phosphatase [Acidimicrobiales bacterium]|nr:trehalose-phosphatase [Acidimicrobiales bacterium]
MRAADHALLAPLRAAPRDAAVVTDFDGTLSPIVDDPARALPLPGVVDTLHALAARYGRVAVVSGRPVRYLRHRLEVDHRPPTPLFLSGLYGIESFEHGVEHVHPIALPFRDAVDDVAARAEAAAPTGVGVERKGFSVTLHVRTGPEHLEWAREWSRTAAGAAGLAVHHGRMSVELRPPVDVDKGSVVGDLVAGTRAACFLGDDLGDLPAFDALDRLVLADADAHALRIAVRSDEAPPELLERADLLVDGPAGSLELLRALLDERS